MLQLIHNETKQVLRDPVTDVAEAWKYAIRWLTSHYNKSPVGKRTLRWLGGVVTLEHAQSTCTLVSFVGIWIELSNVAEPKVPEGFDPPTERNWLVFENLKGRRYIGEYDADDGVFRAGDTELEPDSVSRYYILPDYLC